MNGPRLGHIQLYIARQRGLHHLLVYMHEEHVVNVALLFVSPCTLVKREHLL
jgi:hypothetical protein